MTRSFLALICGRCVPGSGEVAAVAPRGKRVVEARGADGGEERGHSPSRARARGVLERFSLSLVSFKDDRNQQYRTTSIEYGSARNKSLHTVLCTYRLGALHTSWEARGRARPPRAPRRRFAAAGIGLGHRTQVLRWFAPSPRACLL